MTYSLRFLSDMSATEIILWDTQAHKTLLEPSFYESQVSVYSECNFDFITKDYLH